MGYIFTGVAAFSLVSGLVLGNMCVKKINSNSTICSLDSSIYATQILNRMA